MSDPTSRRRRQLQLDDNASDASSGLDPSEHSRNAEETHPVSCPSRRERRCAASLEDPPSEQPSDAESSASTESSELSIRIQRRNERRRGARALETTPEEERGNERRRGARALESAPEEERGNERRRGARELESAQEEEQPPPPRRAVERPRVRSPPEREPRRRDGVSRLAGLEIPSALPSALPEVERKLLDARVPDLVDEEDIYPDDLEPYLHQQPPAPSIGVAKDIYTEVLAGSSLRGFRRVKNASVVGGGSLHERYDGVSEPSEEAEDSSNNYYEPSVTCRVLMLLLGVTLRASQGTLAGLCLMQWTIVPWFNPDVLTQHLSYAPIAMPLQRGMHLCGLIAFLAACDRHVGEPRLSSGVAIVLYGLVLVSIVLQLPTDLSLHLARQDRLPELYAALRLADELRTSRDLLVVDPRLEVTLAVDRDGDGGLYSFGHTVSHLNAWATLIWLRTIAAFVAFLLCSADDDGNAFDVPPLKPSITSSRTQLFG
ncbi:hypothetical protein AB1Y20_004816 [Prymnesium parvum]|uniref:Rhomboid-like protein n=1 Tax=Prymnesium parvum TaxID=97485 RepID=A0AB34IXK9_PRYPA